MMSVAYLESEPEAGSCLTPDIARYVRNYVTERQRGFSAV